MNEKKRKSQDNPQPFAQKPRTKVNKNAPTTSAKSAEKKGWENLTLHDWLTVFKFIDTHPDLPQADIVMHFKTLKEGALIFSQSALSRNIKRRSELEERVDSNPTALLAKRPRIVTRPDVERALVLWICSMEEKGESVTGPMLCVKREKFEDCLKVPKNERLKGEGWVANFCKM